MSAPALAQDVPDLGGREVVLVTEKAYRPLQFLDESGAAVGCEYDVMAEVAKQLNIVVSYENTSRAAMIPAVSEGQYDLGMTGITIKDEWKEQVDFSEPTMRSELLMIVRGDEARFNWLAVLGVSDVAQLVKVTAAGGALPPKFWELAPREYFSQEEMAWVDVRPWQP